MKRLSEEEIQTKIKDLGFTLLENYQGANVKHLLKDKDGKIGKVRLSSILSGHTKSCKGKPSYKQLDNNIFCSDTENLAYIYGFILADGCVSHLKNNKYVITIILKKTKENENLLGFIKRELKISDRKIQQIQKSLPNRDKKYFQVGLRFNIDKKQYEHISQYSIHPRKTYSSYFPTVKDSLLGHFIRGYFDGDGSFSYKKDIRRINSYRARVIFVAKTDSILIGLRDKIGGYITYTRNSLGGYYTLKFSSLKLIQNFYNIIYTNIKNNFYLESKKKKFDEYLKLKSD